MAEDGKNPNIPETPDEPIQASGFALENSLNTDSDARSFLEVEDMPESNELQERRRKTKNRLQELSDVGGETSNDGDAFDDEEEEGGLMDLLREANLSPRHLKFCCSGVLGVFFLIVLFFGAKSLWTYWQNRPVEETPVVEAPSTPVEPDEPDYSFLDPSVLGGILVGEDKADEDPATDAGENLGDNSATGDTFSHQINDFAKIFESLQVDVNVLLNKSSDRLTTLRDYEDELNYEVYLAQRNLEALQNESNGFVEKFTAVEKSKDELEADFFANLQDLDAPAANSTLNAFVEQGQDIVRLRALFNARQKLISYYQKGLEALQFRIKDMGLNEEALVKGVKVVELQGSTLDLILQEGDL